MGKTTVQLIPIVGDVAGEPLTIPDTGLVIGRGDECGHVILGEGISRRHARVVYVGDSLCVEDLESTNGVIVNGQQIKRRQLLVPGDLMQICSHDFRVEGTVVESTGGAWVRSFVLLLILSLGVAAVLAWPRFLAHASKKSQPTYHSISILSDPEGADVYDHGKKVGTTNWRYPKIRAGEYWVLLRKDGYEDRDIKITVPQGTTRKVYILKPKKKGPTFIEVTTLPSRAKVFINGKLRGTTKSSGDPSEQSATLRIEDVDTSKEHQVYIEVNGERSEIYNTGKFKSDLSITLWRPNRLIKTRDGLVRLGMIRRREKDGIVLAVTPKKDVTLRNFDIVENKLVIPPRLRHSRGVKTVNDPKGGLELIVDPFPDAN